MTRYGRFLIGLFLILPAVSPAGGQTFPTPQYFEQLMSPLEVSSQLGGPEGLRDYLVNGKLRLALADSICLALLNNADVPLNQVPVEQARFAVQRAYQPFDPVATSNWGVIWSAGTTTSYGTCPLGFLAAPRYVNGTSSQGDEARVRSPVNDAD